MNNRLFAFKLSTGGYYRSGHAHGQSLYLADIVHEDDVERIIKTSLHIEENIDPDFKMVEVQLVEV